MRYLIFGNGYLGNKFKDYLKDAVIESTRINNVEEVKEVIRKHKPEVVINCAARTGSPNIDWCEDHKAETIDSNLRGPLSLLRACTDLDQYWVQIGSGCIYQGDNDGKGWSEEDPPNFMGSFYSKTKALMNNALMDFPVLQLRLRMPLDANPGPRNFITKITRYPKVINMPNSITVVDDLMSAAKQLMDQKKVGVFNVTNPGVVDHAEIIKLYQEIVDPKHTCEFISLEQLESMTAAPRSNCVLSTEKLKANGVELPEIHERVREILTQYKTNLDQL